MAMASAANAAMAPLTPPADVPHESAKFPDTPMADQNEENPFDAMEAEPEADVETPHLITHAKVYAIAEK